MKHSTLFITGLLLALGSLFVGLQIGKAKLNTQPSSLSSSTELTQTTQTTEASLAMAGEAMADEPATQRLITELKEEITSLKQQLEQKNSLIQSMQSSLGLLEQQVEIAYEKEVQATESNSPFKKPPMTLPLADIEQYVPAPFSQFIASQDGDIVELFQRHHQAEINPEWAQTEQQSIRDILEQHPQGQNIQIDSINCKQSTCEIRAFELVPNSWMDISSGFQQLNHGRNVSSWSTLYGTEDGTVIYMLNEYSESKPEQNQEQDQEHEQTGETTN